jgi:Leucine-rich repeat (LRR) protein
MTLTVLSSLLAYTHCNAPYNNAAPRTPSTDAVPLLRALRAGAAPRLRHLQLPNCRITGLPVFEELVATVRALPRLQTLDLSGNQLHTAEVQLLVAALRDTACRVYEVLCDECVQSE